MVVLDTLLVSKGSEFRSWVFGFRFRGLGFRVQAFAVLMLSTEGVGLFCFVGLGFEVLGIRVWFEQGFKGPGKLP